MLSVALKYKLGKNEAKKPTNLIVAAIICDPILDKELLIDVFW